MASVRRRKYDKTIWDKIEKTLKDENLTIKEQTSKTAKAAKVVATNKPLIDIQNLDIYKTVRKDKLLKEVLAGKMEYAKYKYFDGMTDMWEFIAEDELSWKSAEKDKDLQEEIGSSSTNTHYTTKISIQKISATNEKVIQFSNYYFRYKDESRFQNQHQKNKK